MKHLRFYLLIICIGMFCNCKKNTKSHEVVRINNDGDSIFYDASFRIDTPFRDGITRGYYVGNGKIASCINYDRSYRSGPAVYYFSNGRVQAYINYAKDKEVNYGVYFNDDGTYKEYDFWDWTGNLRFRVKYNQSRIDEVGRFFYIIYDKSKVNQYLIHSALPPGTVASFTVYHDKDSIQSFYLSPDEGNYLYGEIGFEAERDSSRFLIIGKLKSVFTGRLIGQYQIGINND